MPLKVRSRDWYIKHRPQLDAPQHSTLTHTIHKNFANVRFKHFALIELNISCVRCSGTQ